MDKNNQAQHLKREILVRTIEAFLSDNYPENTRLIAYDMRPQGCEVPYRCCVHKERDVIQHRIIANLGLSMEEIDERKLLSDYAKKALERTEPEKDVLTVLETACQACVPSRMFVTDLCQGCVARPCVESCKFGAISIQNGRSIIDGSKCKNCTKCMQVCPYHAIVKIVVPCEDACPVGAITKDESGHATIDFDKCITCGKCVASCPFGAIHEKSQIIDILKAIKEGKKVIAMIAPSIAGQLPGSIYQIHTALLKSGFSEVVEVAQGADITATNEAEEFKERMEKGDKFMTTSCCAGYNNLIAQHLPEIKPFVSTTKTPLYYTAELVKRENPDAVTVFLSPCVAKRRECLENPNVDYLLSYEEMGALFIAKKIDVGSLEPTQFKVESSREARNFGLLGGVAQSVKVADEGKTEIKAHIINGLNKQSIRELRGYAKKGECEMGNLIEVMCCEGGCIGGNCCINNVKTASKAITEFTKDCKPLKETPIKQ